MCVEEGERKAKKEKNWGNRGEKEEVEEVEVAVAAGGGISITRRIGYNDVLIMK